MRPRLDHQSGVDHGDGRRIFSQNLLEPSCLQLKDFRVDNRIKLFTLRLIGKNNRSEFSAIDAAIRAGYCLPEMFDDLLVCRLSWFDYLMSNPIGIQDLTPKRT